MQAMKIWLPPSEWVLAIVLAIVVLVAGGGDLQRWQFQLLVVAAGVVLVLLWHGLKHLLKGRGVSKVGNDAGHGIEPDQ
jgi:hypothetical protein